MQLVAYGAQDIYLTGQPQITFFKSVYRRHTNFAMESIQQTINGNIAAGQQVTSTITRNGDLILGMHVDFPNCETSGSVSGLGMMVCTASVLPMVGVSYCNDLGFQNNAYSLYSPFLLFDSVELLIGGQRIDRIYSDWMVAYAELVFRKDGTRDQFGYALNNPTGAFDATAVGTAALGGSAGVGPCGVQGGRNCMVPFLFYFNNNPGLAVPLIALQYHEVQVQMFLATNIPLMLNPLQGSTATQTVFSNMVLMVDYAYLDTTERRKFAQNAHEYLITQHQRQTDTAVAGDNKIRLNLNHPVKYLMWWTNGRAAATARPHGDVVVDMTTMPTINCGAYNQAKITLNGSDRFSARNMKYFTGTQVYQHWPADCPNQTFSVLNGSLYLQPSVYSFAIRPAEHQPSGTCNFSRIDNAQLELTGVDDVEVGATQGTVSGCRIHAENYNVLRIMSGMGGLAYSN